MRLSFKSLLLIAVCVAGLGACGGANQGNGGDVEQAKHPVVSQKTTASAYNQVVEQLYVAYFGRPADPNGLANFSAQLAATGVAPTIQGVLQAYSTNSTVKALVDEFGTSTESQSLYGSDNPQTFVQAVFNNVLGRNPAASGSAFWIQALESGNATYGNVALQIMDGALTNTSAQGLLDQQLVNNRITVATDFTAEVTTQNATADYSGSAAASTARTMLTGITASTSSGTFQSTVDSTVATIVANAPVNNTVAITVDSGVANNPSVDEAFVSVTICAPSNPSLCQTIDHVLVDTGSYGLRLIYSTLSSQMAAALSAQTNANTLVECTDFIDGYTWGPIRQVNFSIAGETVPNMNMQVIGDPAYSSNSVVPTECSSSGPAENTVDSFGSNGVIGVGLFSNDCGECTTQTVGAYFSCTNLSCTDTIASAAQQVSNPVYQFASDNNGVIVKLPSVSATSPPNTLSGTMVFGINTQSDNALGSASVFQMDENGYFTTVFAGSSMPHSFIDSGSNGLYFPNVTNIATCADDGFYCPRPTVNLSATMQGAPNLVSGVSNTQTVPFSIGYADSVSGAVSVDFGAPNGDNTSFDWGLPFFFGRNVYVAIDGRAAAGQTGPFVAF